MAVPRARPRCRARTSSSRRRARACGSLRAAGVVAIHDKDGWLGAPGIFQRVHDRDGLTLRVWQSLPYERLPELEALGLRSRHRRRLPSDRLPEGVHGRDARLADGMDARRLRRRDHERRASSRRSSGRARALGWPVGVHAIGDRANREALDAFEATRDEWAAARPAAPDRARAVPRAGGRRHASRSSASPARCSSATRPRTATSPSASGPTSSTAPTPSARCWSPAPLVANGSDAPVEELDPLAGIRAGVLRTIDERPGWHPEQCLTVEEALLATTRQPAWLSGDERRARQAPPRLPRRPRRALPRPARVPAGRARLGRGRRDDGRRPVGAQPPALGLMPPDAIAREEGRRFFGSRPGGVRSRSAGPSGARLRDPRRAVRARERARACSRSARAPARRRGVSSTSARTPSSRSSRPRPRALPGALPRRPRGRSASHRSRTQSCGERRSTWLQRRPRSTGSTSPWVWQRSWRSCGRAAGSRSGGRSSAREQRRTLSSRATSPLLEGLDTSPTKGEPGRPAASLSTRKRASARWSRPGSPTSTTRSSVGRDVGHRGHSSALRDVLSDPSSRARARKDILDEIARIAEQRVRRSCESHADDVAVHGAKAASGLAGRTIRARGYIARCSPSTPPRPARSPALPRSSARSGPCSSSTTSPRARAGSRSSSARVPGSARGRSRNDCAGSRPRRSWPDRATRSRRRASSTR